MKKFSFLFLFPFLSLSIVNDPARAVNVSMSFRGTLVVPPVCQINNGDRIDLDFGDRIAINKVDGVSYKKKLDYQVTCAGGTVNKPWSVFLTLSGFSADFDNDIVLMTNRPTLGIKVLANDKVLNVGASLLIDLNNPPVLEMVPVKKPGTRLIAGNFAAAATLSVAYQ